MIDENFILGYGAGKAAGGGGGGGVTVEELEVTQNGTTTAPTGKAYSPVVVNVPNTYAAGDEGKVVHNGGLVAQSSGSTTQNGTVDTTLINSLTVNVSGGGTDLSNLEIYIADFLSDPPTITSGALDGYHRTIVA